MEIFFDLVGADSLVRHMAYYLSESLIHHLIFGSYTAAHLAASSFLLARILLNYG